MAIKPDSHCYIYNLPVKNRNTSGTEERIRSNSCSIEALIQFKTAHERLTNSIRQHEQDLRSCIIDYWYAENYFTQERYECDMCPYSTKFKHMLNVHTRIHVERDVDAHQSSEFTTTTNEADEHALNQQSEMATDTAKKFSCLFCNFQCAQKSTLVYHMKQLHVSENTSTSRHFTCYYCSYKSNHKGTLNTHMRIHTGDKQYHCNKCNFKSSTKSDLKNHIRIHTGEKPYQCKICSYKSTRKSNLNLHLRSHIDKPFNCSICSYRSASKSNLVEHSETHVLLKLFSCRVCNNYETNSRSHLETHLRVHTDEKLFSCLLCNFKCSKESTLETHLSTHDENQMHRCTLCNYSTFKKSNYNIHIKKHEGYEELQCNLCKYTTNKRSTLNKHIKTHSVESSKVSRVTVVTVDKPNLCDNGAIDKDLLELIKQEDIVLKDED